MKAETTIWIWKQVQNKGDIIFMDFSEFQIEYFSKPSKETIYIREIVFVLEQGFIDEFDELDNTSTHILISHNSNPIATARFYKISDENFVIGRFAVIKEYRNKGIGRFLMGKIEEKIIENGGKVMELSAQLQAKGFYESLGYRALGDIYYDQHAKHIHMEKKL